MSEEIKQPKQNQYDETKQAFEQMQVEKFNKWKEKAKQSGQGDEQQAFEQYLEEVAPYKMRVLDVMNSRSHSFNEWVKKATSMSQSTYLNNDSRSATSYDKIKVDDFVILSIKRGQISDNKNTTMAIYARVKKPPYGISNQIDFDGMGYTTGIDTYTKQEIEDKIAHQQPVAPPSVSPNYINLPIEDRTQYASTNTGKTTGAYGLNLIDYRDLSRDTRLGVAGSHITTISQDKFANRIQTKTNGKCIINKLKTQNGVLNGKYIYGGDIGVSGLKKGVQITCNDSWITLPKPKEEKTCKGELGLTFIYETLGRDSYQENLITNKFDEKEETKHLDPTHHGRYQIDMGTKQAEEHGPSKDPSKFAVEFSAYYGSIEPKGLTRDFEFSKINGIELKANNKIADEYYTTKLGDVLVKKVGIVKAKDLKWFHYETTAGIEPHFIFAQVPDDCKVPTDEREEEQMSQLGDNLMSNNLTEVKSETNEHLEQLKFDKYPPYLEQQIVRLPGTDKEHPVWCFIMVSSPTNAKKWHELLSNTTITYELNEEHQKPIYLPSGGFTITLSNGNILNSYNYTKIEYKGNESAYELLNINGSKIKINASQIIAVSPVE